MKFYLFFTCIISFWPLISLAQDNADSRPQSSVAGPRLGFAFDSSVAGFRPILGIPGASTLGDPLPLAAPFAAAYVSPQEEFAIGIAAADNMPTVILLADGSGDMIPIPGVLPGPSLVAFSPDGMTALLYNQAANAVQIITGLPAEPSITRQIDLSQFASAPVALAVSDSAQSVLAGFSGADGGAVYLFSSDGTESFVLSLGQPSSIAFLHGSQDALVTDQAQDTVYTLHIDGAAAAASAVAGNPDGISSPSSIAITDDNARALVLNGNSGQIVTLNFSGGAPELLSCPCTPSFLQRLDAGTFQLTGPSSDPIWLVDTHSTDSRLVFVPPRITAQTRSAAPRAQEDGSSL